MVAVHSISMCTRAKTRNKRSKTDLNLLSQPAVESDVRAPANGDLSLLITQMHARLVYS